MLVCSSCGAENRDGARFCDACGAALSEAPAAGEQRKTVTVLFCDVTGSTELGETLDPEALRAVLARYFDAMSSIVERHGGTVEKFIGDAVMAVFGVPVVHEDDALRAVRAAVEMRDALPRLGVRGRIGVATGEVVTGTAERLATGDAVNVAARLQQAAQPGEIVVGDETHRLTRDAVEVEVMELLALKGKTAAVQAYRLLGVPGDTVRRHGARMVGREREQRLLASVCERAVSERACQLFTILGSAGVGKSRLTMEFLASLRDAVVVRGRCLPYGEGITYWPVIEIVKQLPATEIEPAAAAAVRALVGDEQAAISKEEIARGFRKLLEAVAADRLLVCVFDDVQWGEETFLDLVEHVADISRDAPILLLCIARPDLLDRRPGWAGGKINATNVLLEPLAPEEAERLIDSLASLDDAVAARIREAAEGNPLFVEEMVALVEESGETEMAVPPSIQALLAARLDQLDAPERAVLQCGAVEGRVFHGGAVQALAPEEQRVMDRLTGLVRKELVRPEKAQFTGEDAFRFRHLLLRDTAYDALPKATRAALHERFAAWLGLHGTDLVELDELLGHHLELACRYRQELQLDDEPTKALGVRAAGHLAVTGRRALDRGDLPAAVGLLQRAIALLCDGDARRLPLLPVLGRALTDKGEWEQARAVLSEAVALGRERGDEGVAADATVSLWFLRLHTDPETSHREAERELDDAVRVFEEQHDEAGLSRALEGKGTLRFWHGESAAAMEQFERAALLARRAGDRAQEVSSLYWMMLTALTGPMPVAAALGLVEDVGSRTTGASALDSTVLRFRAQLEAMVGRIDAGRLLIAEAKTVAEELGLGPERIGRPVGEIQLLAGDPAAATETLAAECQRLERMENWGHYASAVPYLADALWVQGRGKEASREIELASRWTLSDDLDAQIGLRRVQARLLALDGERVEAERVALEAVALAEQTDFLDLHAQAVDDLATVLELCAKPVESATARAQALALFERKGNTVMAERLRGRL